jgi:hypothetical protein
LRQSFAQWTADRFRCLALGILGLGGLGGLAALASGCVTEPAGRVDRSIRFALPDRAVKAILLGAGDGTFAEDELGRPRRPTSLFLLAPELEGVRVLVDAAPGALDFATSFLASHEQRQAGQRVVDAVALSHAAPWQREGLAEIAARAPRGARIELLGEQRILDALLVDPAVAAALGDDRFVLRALAPGQAVALRGKRRGAATVRIAPLPVAPRELLFSGFRIEGSIRTLVHLPRLGDCDGPDATAREGALDAEIRAADLVYLDGRRPEPQFELDLALPAHPPLTELAARLERLGVEPKNVRLVDLGRGFGTRDHERLAAIRAAGFELGFEGDQTWL